MGLADHARRKARRLLAGSVLLLSGGCLTSPVPAFSKATTPWPSEISAALADTCPAFLAGTLAADDKAAFAELGYRSASEAGPDFPQEVDSGRTAYVRPIGRDWLRIEPKTVQGKSGPLTVSKSVCFVAIRSSTYGKVDIARQHFDAHGYTTEIDRNAPFDGLLVVRDADGRKVASASRVANWLMIFVESV